ncbi:MAG: hypothetical protein IJU44_06355 [Kiritimatiellae bacterium]|nr:hypothetical protein [Kiritimatiellia bacterium]
MVKFDEYIWRVSPTLDDGRELVHQERDVNFNIDSFNDKDAVKRMIASLIGQDAKCPYSDKLIVVPFFCGSDWVWAIAGGNAKSHEYYSVLLIPIC